MSDNGNNDAALVVAQQNVNALIDPDDLVEAVGEFLDLLAGDGANQGDLAAVQEGVLELVSVAKQLKREFELAISAAKRIQAQREDTRKELDRLVKDVESGNTDNGTVERLHEILQDEIYESLWFQDSMWEEATNAIMQGSPLDMDEAAQLYNLLTQGHIDGNSAVWGQLREWIDEAQREHQIGYGWPPDLD